MIVRRWAAAIALVLLAALTACSAEGPAPTPRPLSNEEAQQLALARFRNFDAGVRPVSFEVTDGGLTYVVEAQIDFVAGVGYGTVSDPAATETLLLGWSAAAVATRPWDAASAPLPVPEVDEAWTMSVLSVSQSRLHAALAILLTLTADRPDNALLLQQSDARWLREDTIPTADGETAVIVVAGPTADAVYDPASGLPDDGSAATLRFWVDELGVLHRLELRLGGSGDWTTVDLGTASGDSLVAELGTLPELLGAP